VQYLVDKHRWYVWPEAADVENSQNIDSDFILEVKKTQGK
jgi:hypothetical protein